MPSYCLLADLKSYLNITTSTDDALLQVLLDAATNRIDSKCARTFQAAGDSVRYFDAIADVDEDLLLLDADLSYVTSVVNGDTAELVNSIYTNPRNVTPYYALGLKLSAASYWTYISDPQNAISVTGRWAYMERAAITALSRSSNVVTATVTAPRLSVGASVFVVGVADTSFNGTFTVTANTGSSITWAQTAANDTDTTGVLLFTPPNIVTACRRLAAWLYRQKDTQQSGTAQPLFSGDGSIVMPSELPADVTALLTPYVKML